MGRGRGATKAAKDGGNTKVTEKASRTTRGARKSYVEDEGSDEDAFQDDPVSSPEEMGGDSGSDFEAESSGSEYGKKKKKVKVSPKKTPAKRGRKPAGKAQLSPKKRGRKPKAAVAASSNGKRKRPAESSEEEEEKSSGEISEDEGSGSGDTSGSEYGKKKVNKKLKKEKATRSQPKRQAAPSPKKRGRKPKEAPNGTKKAKLTDEVENSEEEMEVDEPEKKKSEDEGDGTDEEEVIKPKEDAEKKTDPKEETGKEKEVKTEEGEAESPKSDEANEKVSEVDAEEAPKGDASKKEKTTSSKSDTALMNRTTTDYGSLDFTSDKKTKSGDAWNFKIACWNIGGIKAWVKKDGLEYLKHENPDIVCLQETKCSEKTKPPEVSRIANYPHTYWCYSEEKSGQSGVATFCKTKPESVCNGVPVEDDDSEEDKKLKQGFNKEGRLIVTEFEKFYLLNAYVPNSGRGVKDDKHPRGYPPRLTNGERQAWDRLFRTYIKKLEEKKPVILTGDLNVAHQPIDLANPKTNANTAGFTQEERDGFTETLASLKLIDSFRSLYPNEEKAYTFWSYIGNTRAKNIGWRLDYFLLSEKLEDALAESLMRKDVYGSDHCPIVLFVHL